MTCDASGASSLERVAHPRERGREREDTGFICCHSEKVDYPRRA